ncbi:hypothetical protein [Magnetospirillum sp. SS-4]|uniref:hypothetical protein n=1 Tax=Magnetospirillum sp. SS-4 TaxID=2681465 RepID=UPI001384825F|nr:hypothetical protein [Magnetospirillum sp. SS-4]CAA7615028.1 conserved hypothetical protein [Magnetospirillum sp. SS-4]
MAVNPEHVARAANDLMDHYGRAALDEAKTQVDRASRAGDMPALDQALMVLTEIERHQGSSSTPVM